MSMQGQNLRKSLNWQGFVRPITVPKGRLPLDSRAMGAKFYTHFLMNEQPANVSEFTGVVELNKVPRVADDLEAVAKILAKGMDVRANDIRILHWSRLH